MKRCLLVILLFSTGVKIFAQGGISFETASQATFDTNNVADAGKSAQYYKFTPDFNGYVAIGNCGQTGLDTRVLVYDSLGVLMGTNDDFCDYQTHLIIPVDSSMRYYIQWSLYEGTASQTYNWYMIKTQPEPGVVCSFPLSAVEGMNHVNIPEVGNQWFEYTVSEEAKVVISMDPGIIENAENWDLQIYYDCTYREVDYYNLNDSALAFIVDSPGDYKILFGHYALGDTTEFDWIISEEEIIPGEGCSMAIVANTGNNSFYSEKIPKLYYQFQSPDDGIVTIDFCDVPQDINAYANIYSGSCNNLEWIDEISRSNCNPLGSHYNYSFYADSGQYYYIAVGSGQYTDFAWQLHLREPVPGETCELAIETDTGNIELDPGYNLEVYYSYTSPQKGSVTIDMCNIPDDVLNDIQIYTGDCENLNLLVDQDFQLCNWFKPVINFYTDSAETYIIKAVASVDTSFNWNLTLENVFPGQYHQNAIPVELDDTIGFKPVPDATKIWYEFYSEVDKMITVSTCDLENTSSDINYISVSEKVNPGDESGWSTWNAECPDGMKLEFPADSGKVYLISFTYSSTTNDTITWSLTKRDFETGEICESGTEVEAGTEYELSSDTKYSWHYYIPEEDEYKVIGEISDQNAYGKLVIKDDCDCEATFSYYNYSGCTMVNWNGLGLFLEAGKRYHIGWMNDNNDEITWQIYDITDIKQFSLYNQTKPSVIDHENHTIELTVGHNESVTSLSPEFLIARNIEVYVGDEVQYPGSNTQNFTNPVTYTVSYEDFYNDTVIRQDWVVTVSREEDPVPSGPYTVQSTYLKNPDLAKPFVSNWADFWKTAYDHEYGGFFTEVDREGNPTGIAKTTLSQSRDAYAFARAFMVTGDTAYLNYANGALQFMYNHLWDETNGGWYSSVDADGDLTGTDNYNTYKWSFIQHYANLGIVAMADATGGVRFENPDIRGDAFDEHVHWEMLNNSLDVINENMWDSRDDYYGYYNRADLNWGNPVEKGFTPTVDGITTHGLYMYLLTKDPFFYNRLVQLADNLEEHMIPEMELAVIGYPELYNNDWEMEAGGDMFIGHMFKSAWCLARAYLVNPQERYREAAKVLMYDMMDNGAYDYVNGAPYSGYDWSDGYINTPSKSWWDVEQAYNSGIMNYYISEDEDDKNRFIEVADGSIDFFMENFVDMENGEVYPGTDREGEPLSTYKGDYWKAGYHSTEFAYYAYLYGNLFYKDNPVDLYYFIDAGDQPQSVSLYPLAIEDNKLKIDAVELDGESFSSFDSDTRTLNIAANQGGIFKVTFRNDRYTGIPEPVTNNTLDVNVYPNPMGTTGIIGYSIDIHTDVIINILDITGKVLYTIEKKNVAPGDYEETISRSQLGNANICFIQVKTGTQNTVKKLIVL